MAEFLGISNNGGARYDSRMGMLLACPFCGSEFEDETRYYMMNDAPEGIYCPQCGTPIYQDQFFMSQGLREVFA